MAGAAVGSLLLAAAMLLAGPAARADTAAAITGVGWWTRQPGAAARNGGFQVANAPDGAFSEAAVRIRIDSPSLTKAVLVLTEGGGLRQDSASIQVCATSSSWGPADPGTWDQAPKADCQSRAVKLDRNASQSTWTGDVLALLGAAGSPPASASLVILPVPPAAPVDVGFQVDFTGASLVANGAPPAPAADTGAEPSAATPDISGASVPSTGPAPVVAPVAAPLPTPVAAPAPAASVEPVASPPAPTAAAEPAGVFPRHLRGSLAGRSQVRWERLGLIVPLCALVVAAGAVGHRAWREPDLLPPGWRLPWTRTG